MTLTPLVKGVPRSLKHVVLAGVHSLNGQLCECSYAQLFVRCEGSALEVGLLASFTA